MCVCVCARTGRSPTANLPDVLTRAPPGTVRTIGWTPSAPQPRPQRDTRTTRKKVPSAAPHAGRQVRSERCSLRRRIHAVLYSSDYIVAWWLHLRWRHAAISQWCAFDRFQQFGLRKTPAKVGRDTDSGRVTRSCLRYTNSDEFSSKAIHYVNRHVLPM